MQIELLTSHVMRMLCRYVVPITKPMEEMSSTLNKLGLHNMSVVMDNITIYKTVEVVTMGILFCFYHHT